MKQENKELLLKDLCARFPYKVKVKVSEVSYPVEFDIQMLAEIKNNNWYEYPMPYLRPMLSMTEKEKEEFHKLKQFSVTVVMPNGVSLLKPTYIVDLEENGDGLNHLYDWLNAHYFDYRSLIKKGLAIEAPESMYK